MGWRIPSLSKSNFLSHQLSHLATGPQIHLAMATKPPQLITNVISIILVFNVFIIESLSSLAKMSYLSEISCSLNTTATTKLLLTADKNTYYLSAADISLVYNGKFNVMGTLRWAF